MALDVYTISRLPLTVGSLSSLSLHNRSVMPAMTVSDTFFTLPSDCFQTQRRSTISCRTISSMS